MKIKIDGVQQAVHALNGLVPAVRIRHMRIAINAACGVIKRIATANAPKKTGLLKKSLRVKVAIPQASKNPAHHDKPAWGLVGPGRKLDLVVSKNAKGRTSISKLAAAKEKNFKTVVLKGKTGGRILVKGASRYAHFAEKGRKGKGGSKFLSNAATSGATEANNKFAQKIAHGINVEAARLASKP